MAVTVTYTRPSPVAGGVTPPTALQAETQCVSAGVIATADGDTTATITHNFGLSAAELAADKPDVVLQPTHAAAQTSLWYVSSKTANTVVLTKGTGGGSGNAAEQLQVTCYRPHSMISD